MSSGRSYRHEGGAALLLFLLVLVVVSAGQLLRKLNHGMTNQSVSEADLATQAALLEAKQALLGYAAAFAAQGGVALGPGRLPCAAPLANRIAAGGCGGNLGVELSVGLLPFSRDASTLPSMPNLVDGTGAPLVYVMDGSFRRTLPPAVNIDSVGDITLDGQPTAGQPGIVALVFAPGPSQGGQSRPTGTASVALNAFLEDAENTDGDMVFVSPSRTSNDHVIAITRNDLMCAIRRVVRDAEAQAVDPLWYGTEQWDPARLAALNLLVCPYGGTSNASSP